MSSKLKGIFVSNLDLSIKSGGWSGMNVNVYKELTSHFNCEYAPTINPSVIKGEQVKSILKSYIGLKRNFEFFSEKRLQRIETQFNKQLKSDADFLFFHGTTPWIKCLPHLPYYAYVDATFLTYLDIYLDPNRFCLKEITRIVKQETNFLTKASAIFFSSDWARMETIKRYHLDGHNFHTVSLGGNSPIGSPNLKKRSKNLLFVSMDFERKGGHIAFEAFKLLAKQIKGLTFQIIGDKPPLAIINFQGVCYHGVIDKSTDAGQKQFQDILKEAAILIHPTEKDMTPLIIVEAGYYGIPAIAPARFGIPEMIVDGKTGYLLRLNTANEIAYILKNLLQIPEELTKMQISVYSHMSSNFTWKSTGNKIANGIKATIG